ncbi:MAG TPA: SagB/ThcOx family dehydrogenase [Vicinamibacterales bacterium]|nr:SagB/ThcOx family dehydrogenase [Vicinamibacterales bacterium]
MNASVHAYHDGTKHHFHRFARSLGYLDWASQPNPFRSFAGAPEVPLSPRPEAPITIIGDVLRHALGLSAWKQFGGSRWSLRVNPSSGNLHPTEAYIIAGAGPGLGEAPGVYHYAPDRHALERRCRFEPVFWPEAPEERDSWLIALSSIHWREAWKYGERAFRYCQHDMGHAIAALGIAAANAGLDTALLPDWSQADIAALTGIDRDADYVESEREEAGCLIVVRRSGFDVGRSAFEVRHSSLLAGVCAGQWTGTASQLSEDHTTWSFIDEIAAATRDPGRDVPARPSLSPPATAPGYPPALILQRRSALAFDGVGTLAAPVFLSMVSRVMPQAAAPWNALWWEARIHLMLFVHRVDGFDPGLYLLARDRSAVERLRAACGREFLWERTGPATPADGKAPDDTLPLYLLARGDCRGLARRLSCDQDIAADGFFSLGMLAEFDASLQTFGPAFYRHLFWESGVVGQVLYLAAEATGARATGIGCFYDDPVHETLGLTDHSFQSLYHFTVGRPVDDPRLTSEPGYRWESGI